MDLVCGKMIFYKTASRFNSEQALRIIGYTQNLPAAIKAFKLHFIQKRS
jgi:hypothetical protein